MQLDEKDAEERLVNDHENKLRDQPHSRLAALRRGRRRRPWRSRAYRRPDSRASTVYPSRAAISTALPV
ncbi:hypothetical protein EDB89DRAFT_1970032 [Lactarius sanguifluus]|nr:hypothetical protein EDB89DRAFT_1970032 [Lactarius sanguifluus]